MNKKTLILLSSLGLVIILTGSIILFFKKNNNNQTNNPATSTSAGESAKNLNNNLVETNNQNATSNIPTDLIKKEVDIKAVNEAFLNQIPNINNQQLDSFTKIVLDGDMHKCESLDEAINDQCKYYFATYNANEFHCADISDNKLQLTCYEKLVFNSLQARFDKCNKETNVDVRVNCLNSLFWAIKDVDSCKMFSNDFVYQNCIDSTILKLANAQNKENCNNIKDIDIKNLCNQSFVVGDFDKDGLSDAEELKIGTNPYIADTDGDGVSDKEEVSKSLNPCGEGKMPTAKVLLETCTKFKK